MQKYIKNEKAATQIRSTPLYFSNYRHTKENLDFFSRYVGFL